MEKGHDMNTEHTSLIVFRTAAASSCPAAAAADAPEPAVPDEPLHGAAVPPRPAPSAAAETTTTPVTTATTTREAAVATETTAETKDCSKTNKFEAQAVKLWEIHFRETEANTENQRIYSDDIEAPIPAVANAVKEYNIQSGIRTHR